MINDEDFELVKALLESLSGMDLISLHSYLRLEHKARTVNISDIMQSDTYDRDDLDFEMVAAQLLAYIEIEFKHRNLN